MEETKIKPSFKPIIAGVGLLIVGLILLFLISIVVSTVMFPESKGLIFGGSIITLLTTSPILIFLIGIGVAVTLVNKAATTYKLSKNNEVIIEYSFINSSSKVLRSDQITSLRLSQTFIEKMLDVGTIVMGVFGKNSLPVQQTQQQQQQIVSSSLDGIPLPRKYFDEMANNIGVEFKKSLYKIKPKISAQVFVTVAKLILTILFVIGYVIIDFYVVSNILGIISIIFLLSTISSSISIAKMRKTSYSFSEKTLYIEHDYLLSRRLEVVPIHKITNFQISQNLITYGIFGISHVQIFTGGHRDPVLFNVAEEKELSTILSDIVKTKKPHLTKEKLKSLRENIENPLHQFKPGLSFIMPSIITNIVIALIIILALKLFLFELALIPSIVNEYSLLIYVGIGTIIAINLLLKLLMWRNIEYKTFESKFIKKKGIISISKEEIDYNNIKYISLIRGPVFERLFDEANIIVFTSAGNLVLANIPQYDQHYNTIKKNILK